MKKNRMIALLLAMLLTLSACGQPAAPETPEEPEKVETPTTPETPEQDKVPEAPAASEGTEKPEESEKTAEPEKPAESEKPAEQETPATPEQPAEPEKPAEVKPPVTVTGPAVETFTLTYSAADSLMDDLAAEFGTEIQEKTTKALTVAADTAAAAGYEILFGETSREESKKVYEKLELGQYAVVATGNKIVIAGRGLQPLDAAAQYFLDTYLQAGEMLTVPENQEYYAGYQYDYFSDILVGKSINILGDSYIEGASLGKDKVWCEKLARKYEMDFDNHGDGGTTIAESPAGRAKGDPMYERYQKMDDEADIVMVVGGRNDYLQHVPLGKLGDVTPDTFYGAVAYLIYNLQAKYPDSLLLFSSPFYYSGQQLDYNRAVKEVCAALRVPCFEADDQEKYGIYMDKHNFRLQYSLAATDGNHLNDDGMWLVLPHYEKFIAEEAEKFFK